MMGGSQTAIYVGQCRKLAVIRPHGRCTALVCTGLRQYLQQMIRPGVEDVYFDLSDAEWLDSTFIGLLISYVQRKSDPQVPAIHLVRPSKAVLDNLGSMYVLPLFDVCDAPPEEPTGWTRLPDPAASAEQLADVVVSAHESLIDADERNEAAFGGVVKTFRSEMDRQRTDS